MWVVMMGIALGSMVAGAQEQIPQKYLGNSKPLLYASELLRSSEAFPYDQMAVRTMANGGESRNVVQGVLATGEGVALHESLLPVGSAPNPGHAIQHSEFIVVREGTLEFEHDGKQERAGPGGVIYVALGTMHKILNVGNVPAKYVVIAIGGDTKK